MSDLFIIYCPDCRGKFSIEGESIQEDDVIECDLCGAEMIVTQTGPLKIKPYSEDEDF